MKKIFIFVLFITSNCFADWNTEPPMHVSYTKEFSQKKSADVLILTFWQKDNKPILSSEEDLGQISSWIHPALESGDFKAKEGEFIVIYPPKEKRIVLLGLGKQEKFSFEGLKKALAPVIKSFRSKMILHYQLLVPQHEGFLEEDLAGNICEVFALASYSFDELKQDVLKDDPKLEIKDLELIGVGQSSSAVCQKNLAIAISVNFARDLVNQNADAKSPQRLGQIAKELSEKFPSIKTTVLNKAEIEQEKLGLLLAVARGSSVDPAFITLEYNGNPKSTDKTVIIGKGIVYDTGGLNLKPTGGMESMKCDMAGAAAVLGTMRVIATLKLPVNVIGVIPATENSIGPSSYKPGDVYRSHSGKTVEVNNTDAEGRLVLADAISYAQQKFSPTRIIDLATLTGAICVALGEEATGLFSNNEKLSEALIVAGKATGEKVWPFPLYPEYKEIMKSTIADIKNSGGREAGSITAAIFLEAFIKDIPWAHLDIAGTAFLNKPKSYHPTQATGVGVRLLVSYLENIRE